jgi:hypothetical protein
MSKAARRQPAPPSETPSETLAVRFSAPCNIGPPIAGVEPGSVIEIEGPTPNAGRYVVKQVDDDWMQITDKVIEDHARAQGVKVSLVQEVET